MANSMLLDRRSVVTGLALAALGATSIGSALAQTPAKGSPPILVTSLGQSLDAFQVQLAVKRSGVPYQYDAHAEPAALGEAKTLFLAVGASLKGFGDAGITINDELARASHLIDAAKAKNMMIVVVHMGGADRRDPLSNQLINIAAPQANLLIIRNDSDADGLFAGISKQKNIPLIVLESVAEIKKPLAELFGGKA